ncbi:MAG: hypothetical protein DRG20_03355 [Deltaproteobacteria bacterium]|nr:cytochrome c biogenesis protein ResB [Deltaproteobacteria bacterium]RLA90386.1 MAG: hypothetical protein DRG20_03355 [Deltaproteobacteria bacterium]
MGEKSLRKIIWDFFCSVKLTVILLFGLAGTSVIGTLIKQNASSSEYLKIMSPVTFRILDLLGFLDMYHSLWFRGILILLALNLFFCSLKRLPSTLRIVRSPKVFPRKEFLLALPFHKVFLVSSLGNPLEGKLKDILKSFFGKVKFHYEGETSVLFAQKGILSRFGVYVTHFSVIIIFIGALIGNFYGFTGYVNLREGEEKDYCIEMKRDEIKRYPLNFDLKLNSFSVSFYDTGAPKEYKSILTLKKGDKVIIKDKVLRVNHPISYKGISIYQNSYQRGWIIGVKGLSLHTPVIIKGSMGDIVEIPHTKYSVRLLGYKRPTKDRSEMVEILLIKEGKPLSIFWITNRPTFLHNKLEFVLIKPFWISGLQIVKDPGVNIVWLGCIFLILGLIITFFVSHAQVWIYMEKSSSPQLIVAGRVNRNKSSFREKMNNIFTKVENVVKDG